MNRRKKTPPIDNDLAREFLADLDRAEHHGDAIVRAVERASFMQRERDRLRRTVTYQASLGAVR